VTTATATETWVEVDDPELAKDDVPVSRDVSSRRVLVLQLLVFLAAGVVGLVLKVVDLEGGPRGVLETGAKLASAAVALSLVDRLGWYRRVGFCAPRRWRRVGLAWLPAGYTALVLVIATTDGAGGRGLAAILGIAGLALAVGFEEELWTRGLLLETLRWKGTTAAVVLSSLWFGVLHSLNLLSGQPASTTAFQVVLASSFGLALGAIRVRVGTLWLPIALHALYDLGVLLQGDLGLVIGKGEVAGLGWREVVNLSIVVALPLAAFGLVLARPSKVPGPDGRMPRRRVKVEPWEWPETARTRTEAVNVLGRWPAPPPDLVDQWYRR
jgi:membrane protease YdiL (CAAX protease family)